MAQNYETEIQEQDEGYSLPKILVAILLLGLIGAGSYIYFQQKKLNTSISYLLNSKKQAEQDLNEMIEKYNLAIEDNGSLEGDLVDERDQIVRFRDSIKSIKKEDLKKATNFKKTISSLKKKSSVESISSFVDNDETTTNNSGNNRTSILENRYTTQPKINTSATNVKNNTSNTNVEPNLSSAIVESNKNIDSSKSVKKEEVKPVEKKNTTFSRVEIPPIYPGCSGSIEEQKLCFAKKIKKHLARKFDATIIEYLDLQSGSKKIWINFDINKNGNIVNVTARAPNNMSSKAKKKLETEAIRVVKKLPRMIPAKQNGETVNINYTVPLTVVVQ